LDNLPPPGIFTVSFNKDNNDPNPQIRMVNNNGTIANAMPEMPERENFTFIGWNTRPDGDGDYFTPNTPVIGNITIYAKWVDFNSTVPKHTLTVTSTTGGTVNPMFLPDIPTGTAVSISAIPSSIKYRFKDWTVTSGSATFANAENASTTVTLSSDAIIRANFQEGTTIIREFTTVGSHSFNYNEGVPATIEVYALGAGGGGQGGSYTYHAFGSNTHGTGGAGGGGAAAYMKFDVSSSVSINTTIGRGGTGGNGHSPTTGRGDGHPGQTGGITTVTWSGNTLTVRGGQGGGEADRNNRQGGSGGPASVRPSVITNSTTFWRSAAGNRGENGAGNAAGIGGFGISQGGNSGLLNVGSWSAFGGAQGGYNYGVTSSGTYYSTSAGVGAGGSGGFRGNNTGNPGGNGYVIIYVTYWK